jgi:4-oxalomesaconate tautomerase
VTCIDNGMPVVVVAAAPLGIAGYESPAELEANEVLRDRLERLRLLAGPLMGLGDVTAGTVPKLTIVAPPVDGGTLSTRTFIPHRVHPAIGVLGAVSVATAVALDGSVAADVRQGTGPRVRIEHPTGFFDTELDPDRADARVAVLSTARKIADGTAWPREA